MLAASTGAAPAAPAVSPLTWKRGRFKVVDGPPALREVEGLVSGFFGIFRDDPPWSGAGRHHAYFCLNHLPTGYFLAKLRLRRECKAMAAELAVLDIRWVETDPERVTLGDPDAGKAQEIYFRYKRRAEGRDEY